MTAEEFSRAIRALYGDREPTAAAADDLGVLPVTVRRWASGKKEIHEEMASKIKDRLRERMAVIGELLDAA